MLSCKDISHLASDHIDNNLPFFTKLKVKMHIFICHDCRNFMNQFRSTVQTMGKMKSTIPDNIDVQVEILKNAAQQNKMDHREK